MIYPHSLYLMSLIQKLSTERQYETFESAYISGINLSSKALMDLEKLRKQEMSIPEFMANYIKYDFLGEA